jgi:hypothetical protein
LRPQRRDHGKAVALGQHAVDHQHVVAAIFGQRETILAIEGVFGHVPDLAERLDQIVRRFAVIFDNEQAHGVPVRRKYSLPKWSRSVRRHGADKKREWWNVHHSLIEPTGRGAETGSARGLVGTD